MEKLNSFQGHRQFNLSLHRLDFLSQPAKRLNDLQGPSWSLTMAQINRT